MRAHRAAQAQEKLKAGSAYTDLDLVFATLLGQPLDERNMVQRSFKPLLAKAELPKTVRLYDLRHTAATLMLASGASPRTVAERLGHASAKMTLDVYAHVLQPQRDDLTSNLEAALFSAQEVPIFNRRKLFITAQESTADLIYSLRCRPTL